MATKNKATKAKSSTKAKAKKAPRKAPSEGGKFDRAKLDTSWKAAEIAKRRATHHKVKVGTKEFGSVYKAFLALGLPVWQHQAFRKVLKLSKRATFTYKGKALNFATIA